MQITSIHVENFKSLVDFDLDMAKFTCLIGLNGSGKSTPFFRSSISCLNKSVGGSRSGWRAGAGILPNCDRS